MLRPTYAIAVFALLFFGCRKQVKLSQHDSSLVDHEESEEVSEELVE